MGVLKDNGTNCGQIQSAQYFLNPYFSEAQQWQNPVVPEDIFVALQVIWVTSVPHTLLFLLTDDPEPVSMFLFFIINIALLSQP